MSELVTLESIDFEYTVDETGIPVKKAVHDIHTSLNGELVVSDGRGSIINERREQELMRLLKVKEVYATVKDKELYYNGR